MSYVVDYRLRLQSIPNFTTTNKILQSRSFSCFGVPFINISVEKLLIPQRENLIEYNRNMHELYAKSKYSKRLTVKLDRIINLINEAQSIRMSLHSVLSGNDSNLRLISERLINGIIF